MIQLKDLCTVCNHWTITEVEHDGTTATFTCTHCKNAFEMDWDTETRFLIRSIRHSLKKNLKQHPELKALKNAGDAIKIASPQQTSS